MVAGHFRHSALLTASTSGFKTTCRIPDVPPGNIEAAAAPTARQSRGNRIGGTWRPQPIRATSALPARKECVMGRTQGVKRRIASALAVLAMMAITVSGGATTASAADKPKPPPGYAGPSATCNGAPHTTYPLSGTPGYVDVWLDPAGSGTYCARTFDNLAGDHHMEIILQRVGWETRWYDSGTFSTYAGAIYVSGANTYCTWAYAVVTVDGVNHFVVGARSDGWFLVC
jgi:hypothetical protein